MPGDPVQAPPDARPPRLSSAPCPLRGPPLPAQAIASAPRPALPAHASLDGRKQALLSMLSGTDASGCDGSPPFTPGLWCSRGHHSEVIFR